MQHLVSKISRLKPSDSVILDYSDSPPGYTETDVEAENIVTTEVKHEEVELDEKNHGGAEADKDVHDGKREIHIVRTNLGFSLTVAV